MPSERKLVKLLKEYARKIETRHRGRSRRRKRIRSSSRSSSRPRASHGRSHSRSRSRSPRSRSRSRSPVHGSETTPVLRDPPDPEAGGDQIPAINPYSEALGDDYVEPTKYDENIHDDISRRWSHILVNGLNKEQRETILKKYKVPKNCTLLEAPAINLEIKNVLTESSKLRDKSIEIGQAQLGLATAIIGKAMTQLMNEETNKVHAISMLSDASKLLTDVNFHQTKTRKKLITPSLDKSFNQIIENTKRNNFLFGDDLSETIKTSKQLQQSAAQIKKTVPVASNAKANKAPGNRNGPPPRPKGKGMTRGGPKTQDFQPAPSYQPHHQPKRYNTNQYQRRPERSTKAPRNAAYRR